MIALVALAAFAAGTAAGFTVAHHRVTAARNASAPRWPYDTPDGHLTATIISTRCVECADPVRGMLFTDNGRLASSIGGTFVNRGWTCHFCLGELFAHSQTS